MQVVANTNFTDMETGRWRCLGEKWEVTPERALGLCTTFISGVPACSIVKSNVKKKKGKRIIIFQNYLYKIGGIETMNITLSQMFPDSNVLFLYGNAFPQPLIELAKVWEVERFERNKDYDCDILILNNHDAADIAIEHIKAKKIYQMVHADYNTYVWEKPFQLHDGVQLVAVSEIAKKGIKDVMGYDAKVCENPVLPIKKPTILLTLSRATKEKGFVRMYQMAQKMKDKNYIWIVATELQDAYNVTADKEVVNKMLDDPHFIFIPPSLNAKLFTTIADYVVQLSDTESFCYSAYESLMSGTPVILTDFPQALKIAKDGVNGYILKRDMSNVDDVVKNIFKKKPTGFPKPQIKTRWKDIMCGKL